MIALLISMVHMEILKHNSMTQYAFSMTSYTDKRHSCQLTRFRRVSPAFLPFDPIIFYHPRGSCLSPDFSLLTRESPDSDLVPSITWDFKFPAVTFSIKTPAITGKLGCLFGDMGSN